MKKRRARDPGLSVLMIDANCRHWMPTILPLMLLLLSACASSPVAIEGEAVEPHGPAHVLDGQSGPGDRVVWGGRIVSIRNLADHTEIGVVSYPLDRGDRPRLHQDPGVRFLLHHAGFLEPVQYAPGRYLTVLGVVSGIERREVDQFLTEQPVIEAERLHLWPADVSQWQPQTRFSIGLGISL